ncbi:MAG TPA: alpha/beta fold hydrolase, partial [Polyangia bacterium]
MSLPGDFVDVGGLRVFVHREGSGPPLLLIHGFLLDHWGWRGVMPAIAERFTVLAPDLPGFGESDRPRDFPYDFRAYADVVDGLCEALALKRVALVGHSMGGGVA